MEYQEEIENEENSSIGEFLNYWTLPKYDKFALKENLIQWTGQFFKKYEKERTDKKESVSSFIQRIIENDIDEYLFYKLFYLFYHKEGAVNGIQSIILYDKTDKAACINLTKYSLSEFPIGTVFNYDGHLYIYIGIQEIPSTSEEVRWYCREDNLYATTLNHVCSINKDYIITPKKNNEIVFQYNTEKENNKIHAGIWDTKNSAEFCEGVKITIKGHNENYYSKKGWLKTYSKYFESLFSFPGILPTKDENNNHCVQVEDLPPNGLELFTLIIQGKSAIINSDNISDVIFVFHRLLCESISEYLYFVAFLFMENMLLEGKYSIFFSFFNRIFKSGNHIYLVHLINSRFHLWIKLLPKTQMFFLFCQVNSFGLDPLKQTLSKWWSELSKYDKRKIRSDMDLFQDDEKKDMVKEFYPLFENAEKRKREIAT